MYNTRFFIKTKEIIAKKKRKCNIQNEIRRFEIEM